MHHTCLASRLARYTALAALFLSPAAMAAGMFVPDNGSSVLSRGGSSVGFLDTAYALQFNPAGLPFSNGLDVRVDLMMLNWGESFAQKDSSVTATNTGGLTVAPMVMVSYRLPGVLRQLAFGIGAWGPPGVINYKFLDPRKQDLSDGQQAALNTPTRYNNISQTTVVIFPSVGIGWRPIPQVSVGVTAQYVYSTIQLATSEVGQPASLGGATGVGDVNQDIIASIDVKAKPRFTAIMGLIINPIPDLILSGSFRPTIPLDHPGTLQTELGSTLRDDFSAKITPDKPSALLRIALPAVVRAGANYKWQRLSGGLEFVWEKWSDNKQFELTTNAQSSVLGGAPQGIPTTYIVNNWKDTLSTRLGLGYDFFRPADKGFLLQGNIGGLFEPNAIPPEYQTLPYITGSMAGASAGVTFAWKGFGLTVSGLYLIPQAFDVDNSKVPKPVPLAGPSDTPEVIGNGHYTANIWMIGIGLSYHGLGENI